MVIYDYGESSESTDMALLCHFASYLDTQLIDQARMVKKELKTPNHLPLSGLQSVFCVII